MDDAEGVVLVGPLQGGGVLGLRAMQKSLTFIEKRTDKLSILFEKSLDFFEKYVAFRALIADSG